MSLNKGDRVHWTQVVDGDVTEVNPYYFTVTFDDGTDWSFEPDQTHEFEVLERADNSRGYLDGDVVYFDDNDVIIRYDCVNDAWFTTGADWAVNNEFDYSGGRLVFRRP